MLAWEGLKSASRSRLSMKSLSAFSLTIGFTSQNTAVKWLWSLFEQHSVPFHTQMGILGYSNLWNNPAHVNSSFYRTVHVCMWLHKPSTKTHNRKYGSQSHLSLFFTTNTHTYTDIDTDTLTDTYTHTVNYQALPRPTATLQSGPLSSPS